MIGSITSFYGETPKNLSSLFRRRVKTKNDNFHGRITDDFLLFNPLKFETNFQDALLDINKTKILCQN
jgi:hypothetical protein